MNPPPGADLRYELKFVADEWHYHTLLAWLRTRPQAFRTAYPPRRVNSVYFDRGELASYVESVEGISERAKVRFRWYGEPSPPQSGRLEVKLRRNRLGWKLVYRVEGLDASAERWSELRARIGRAVPPDGRAWLDEYDQHIILVSYRRDYWVSGDGLLRVTFDRDLEIYDQRSGSRFSTSRRLPSDSKVVLEVKCGPERAEAASRLVSGLSLPRLRNSKYCTAVEAILGRR